MQTRAYHHGDLANALVDAGVDLARTGGPEAVALREVARRVGVSATAAYRHFANHADLIHAIKERAFVLLAAAMQADLAAVSPTGDAAVDAQLRLRAIGHSYLRFAFEQTGLFRIAFDRRDKVVSRPGGDGPAYRLLVDVVADVEAGTEPSRRLGEITAWAAIHGLAVLMLDGPLRGLPAEARAAAADQLMEMVIRGLTADQ